MGRDFQYQSISFQNVIQYPHTIKKTSAKLSPGIIRAWYIILGSSQEKRASTS